MLKRAFDIAASLIGLVLASPLLAVIAAWIKLDSPGPVFHRGVRVGRFGRPFRIFKFRSMVVDAEALGASSTTSEDARITRAGRFVRRWKLDEIPQLLNVLMGDMSLVGPRPQVPWAVALYTDQQKRLLSVRPGITDEASIQFRNEGEILRGHPDPDAAYLELIAPEKIRLGLEYVDRHSFLGDLKIVLKTLAAVAGMGPDETTPAARASESRQEETHVAA
jgi:lipopolysaccharide/colanic/teichoic acid biosynthesis glycosyltransferase